MGMFMAGYYAGKKKGTGTAETMFDRISGLPTMFAFDIADGWRGEVCSGSDPIEYPQEIATNSQHGDWGEEYTSSVIISKRTKAFYLRIFKGPELKMVTSATQTNRTTKWYASDGTNIGDLKKTIVIEYSDFSTLSVDTYSTNELHLPSIYLEAKMTNTTNGTIETSPVSIRLYLNSFFSNNEIFPTTYAEFVKALRKMSDEYNKTEEE